jgi:hypothetical protein
VGDPARGAFERRTPLAQLGQRTTLAWQSIDRVGDDLRIVARVVDARGSATHAVDARGIATHDAVDARGTVEHAQHEQAR